VSSLAAPCLSRSLKRLARFCSRNQSQLGELSGAGTSELPGRLRTCGSAAAARALRWPPRAYMRAGGDKCKMFGAAQSQFARGRAAGSSGRAADCCVAAGRASCPAGCLAGWLARRLDGRQGGRRTLRLWCRLMGERDKGAMGALIARTSCARARLA